MVKLITGTPWKGTGSSVYLIICVAIQRIITFYWLKARLLHRRVVSIPVRLCSRPLMFLGFILPSILCLLLQLVTRHPRLVSEIFCSFITMHISLEAGVRMKILVFELLPLFFFEYRVLHFDSGFHSRVWNDKWVKHVIGCLWVHCNVMLVGLVECSSYLIERE